MKNYLDVDSSCQEGQRELLTLQGIIRCGLISSDDSALKTVTCIIASIKFMVLTFKSFYSSTKFDYLAKQLLTANKLYVAYSINARSEASPTQNRISTFATG